jgi:hypothetical protein
MSEYEHYKEAERLASLLVQEEAKEYADSLLNSMIEGCTGTEIFMGLKWNIKNILKLDQLSKETKKCARQLHKELNKVLRACD